MTTPLAPAKTIALSAILTLVFSALLAGAASAALGHAALPAASILCTILIMLLAHAALLGLLVAGPAKPLQHFWTWLHIAALALLALLPVFAFGRSSLRALLISGVVIAGQLLLVTALHALARLIFSTWPRLADGLLFVIVGLALSAALWSRGPIQSLPREGVLDWNATAAHAVLRFSPPLTLAAIWNQESDGARGTRSEERLDLIRAPLTYDVWLGSYQALPYPQILPGHDGERWSPGWAVSLLILGALLLAGTEATRALLKRSSST